jgi:60 kDa SS-A/Ro ribonucleoprotein
MARTNLKPTPVYTHEGAPAKHTNAEQMLRRSVMANMLWENEFYEDGDKISDRIKLLCGMVSDEKLANIAIEARTRQHLRHVPLLLAVELVRKHSKLAKDVIAQIIQRPDELTEFLSIYWKDGRCPIAAQAKKGLALAFTKFNEYQLAKYNRDNSIKLRDVLFLSHAKPKDDAQATLWKKLVDGELAVPDTWEVALSSGEDKKKTWERLVTERKLGGLATLRNLRNMQNAGVSRDIIREAITVMRADKVLPFRFIAAAKYALDYEPELELSMFECLRKHLTMGGRTILLVDVSGSMNALLSSKSDLSRLDAACGLAMMLREICQDVSVYTFSNSCVVVPARRGFALAQAIKQSQYHEGTDLGLAVRTLASVPNDRLIIITDEQSHTGVPDPQGKGYVINVASNKNGIGYGAWTHIDGFSEAVVDYIIEYETLDNQ